MHNPIYDLMILNEFQEHFNLMRKRQYQLKYGYNNLQSLEIEIFMAIL